MRLLLGILLIAQTVSCGWLREEAFKEMVPRYFLPYILNLNKRMPSYPLITGDTFRDFCDFIVDETNLPFDPTDVKPGDVIFLTASPFILNEFFTYQHPKIPNRYIIVTHNHDYPMPGDFADYLNDPKIIAWFSKNIDREHPKLKPIPIGVPNPIWTDDGYCSPDVIKKVLNNIPSLENRNGIFTYLNVYAHPLRANYELRMEAINYFNNKNFCVSTKRKSGENYLNDLKRFKFVVSPPGNGIDCFRTWEALLMGAIPIVQSSPIDKVFDDLPVIIVKRWDEVTPQFLQQKYKEISQKKFNMKKLFIDYWLEEINRVRQDSRTVSTPIH